MLFVFKKLTHKCYYPLLFDNLTVVSFFFCIALYAIDNYSGSRENDA